MRSLTSPRMLRHGSWSLASASGPTEWCRPICSSRGFWFASYTISLNVWRGPIPASSAAVSQLVET